ncbi:YciI family protein [Brevibacillus daliensis]|uniref:YciI family protein n=1 Tax=Brevibacillus daliensis TaxID=2892995 RepID=UPI001E43C3B0|nr:YciI family protein [Brevibacillus daliensis]
MAYFVATLLMKDAEKNLEFRPNHLTYLEKLIEQGKVYAKGPFADGSGGMVIYQADSLEEATQLAESDPYVVEGVRHLELKQWNMG